MAYATLQDVRDFGVSTADASDSRVTRALARATKAIDDYTGRTFGVEEDSTYTVDGITGLDVVIPSPFADITAVTVNGFELSEGQWEVRSYGIRIVPVTSDPDGFPVYFRSVLRAPRMGATVKVSATFGSDDVDPIIVDACIMLAAGYARMRADDLLPASQVASIASGGVSVSQVRTTGATTGNLEVDAMLDGFIFGGGLVR